MFPAVRLQEYDSDGELHFTYEGILLLKERAALKGLHTVIGAQLERMQALLPGITMSKKLEACRLLALHVDMSAVLDAADTAAQFSGIVETYERYGGMINGLSAKQHEQLHTNVRAIGTFDKPEYWKWGRRDCKHHIILWQTQQAVAPTPQQTLSYVEGGLYDAGLPSPINGQAVAAWAAPTMEMISELSTDAPVTLVLASHGLAQGRGDWGNVGQTNWPVDQWTGRVVPCRSYTTKVCATAPGSTLCHRPRQAHRICHGTRGAKAPWRAGDSI